MRAAMLMTVFLGLGLATLVRAEVASGPVPVPPAAQPFRLGTLKLWALHDANYVVANDAKIFGADAGVAAVGDVLRAAGAPTDRVLLSVNALLVQTRGRILLLDTGIGPKSHGALLASLGVAGVAPSAVTDVLITHSHGDHVGGLLDANGQLAFPNAAIRMASAEWAWMQKQGAADLVKAIAPSVRVFEPGAPIAPGVASVALDGHTPGHVGYEIVSGRARLLDIGDLAHSFILSLANPQWSVGFDGDTAVARVTRLNTLAALAKDNELVFAPHFPFPGVGHVVARGDAFAWEAGVP